MINITTPSQITKIYLVTNCHGNPNKVYIGKTTNCRKQKHRLTFGKEITYDYIDEVGSLDKKDWKPLETFWIRQFKNFGFEVLNENEGGGGPSFFTDSSKLKMSISGKKKIVTQKTKDKIGLSNKKPKPESFKETMRVLRTGTIRLQESTDKMVAKLNKPVTQVDIKGNVVEYFDSIIKASKATGIIPASISDCLSGKIPFTSKNKYRFFYTKDINEFHPLTFKYKVYYNDTVKEYNSINNMKNNGITQRTIYNCLNNKDGIYKSYKIIKT